MKSSKAFVIVLVTAPSNKTARKLASAALQGRLVACANLVPGVESQYWWQGKIESAREVLVIFKTVRRNLVALEKFILVTHPYDTPEFLVLEVAGGTTRYLDWIEQSVS